MTAGLLRTRNYALFHVAILIFTKGNMNQIPTRNEKQAANPPARLAVRNDKVPSLSLLLGSEFDPCGYDKSAQRCSALKPACVA